MKDNREVLNSIHSLNAYMKQIKQYPILSAAEEKALAYEVFIDKSTTALYRLVVCNLRYVVKVAKSYHTHVPQSDLLDLIQEGNLGLIHAIEKFDPSRGYRLLTYGTSWIRAYIQRAIGKSFSVVKHSVTYSNGKYSTTYADLSLDSPIESGEGLTFMELLYDSAINQDEQVIDDERLDIAEKAMGTLSEKERYIIENRFITKRLKTLNELGSEFGVSREYIRQVEEKAKKKMYKYACNY